MVSNTNIPNSFNQQTKKQEFKNTYRQRINIKGESLLLENDNYRKRLVIKIVNSVRDYKKQSVLMKSLTFQKMNVLQKLNFLIISGYIIYESSNLITSIHTLSPHIKVHKKDKYMESADMTITSISNSLFKIYSIYKVGNFINFLFPNRLFYISIFQFMVPYIIRQICNSSYFSQPQSSTKFLISSFNSFSSESLILSSDLYNQTLLSFSIVLLLDRLLLSKVKYTNLKFLPFQVKYFNTKNPKMLLSLFFISKITKYLSLLGLSSIDISSFESIVTGSFCVFLVKKSLLLSISLWFMFNPYSYFIFSSTKNSLNEDIINRDYKNRSRLEKVNIYLYFMLINLFLYSKDVYF